MARQIKNTSNKAVSRLATRAGGTATSKPKKTKPLGTPKLQKTSPIKKTGKQFPGS